MMNTVFCTQNNTQFANINLSIKILTSNLPTAYDKWLAVRFTTDLCLYKPSRLWRLQYHRCRTHVTLRLIFVIWLNCI